MTSRNRGFWSANIRLNTKSVYILRTTYAPLWGWVQDAHGGPRERWFGGVPTVVPKKTDNFHVLDTINAENFRHMGDLSFGDDKN